MSMRTAIKNPLAFSTLVLALSVAALFAPQAFGQGSESKEAAAPPPVSVGLELEDHEAVAGETIKGVLTLVHQEGFASWPADASLIPSDFGLATPLSFALDSTSAAFATLDSVTYPDPVQRTTTDSFLGGEFDVLGYAGTVEFPVIITMTQDTEASTITFDITLQAFTKESEGEFETISVSAALNNPNAPQPIVARASFFGIPMPDFTTPSGTLLLFLFAVIGGFVLNLTPCVLPVIPLKVMTLTQHAGESRGRALFLGGIMSLGVIAFWTLLGAPLAIIVAVGGDFIDPSAFIFGRWWITLAIGAIIFLMGLGIMGMFSISLPQKTYMINPSADNASGSFLFGVMAAVLGLPCFGFVVAPLLAGAATMPPLSILMVFVGLGVGMGVPYLVFSLYPKLLAFMPKAGPASELIKQIMGLLLIAGALFFVGAGINSLYKAHPFLKEQLVLWLITGTVIGAGALLAYQTVKITKSPARRFVFVGLGLLIIAAPVAVAVQAGTKAHTKYERERDLAEDAAKNGYTTGGWNTYSAEIVEKAANAGAVIVIDFTADWCINCKFLKAQVLEVKPVDPVLFGPGVVPFKADIDYPEAKAFHKELGFTGIPQLMIYGPGLEQPWISSGYTPQQVLDAIKQAQG